MTDISLWSLFVAQDVSVTRTGVPCENDTLCRNSGDTPGRERPWCFTDEAADEWDYCNVFFCKRRFITSTKSTPRNTCNTKILFTAILSVHKFYQLAWKTPRIYHIALVTFIHS